MATSREAPPGFVHLARPSAQLWHRGFVLLSSQSPQLFLRVSSCSPLSLLTLLLLKSSPSFHIPSHRWVAIIQCMLLNQFSCASGRIVTRSCSMESRPVWPRPPTAGTPSSTSVSMCAELATWGGGVFGRRGAWYYSYSSLPGPGRHLSPWAVWCCCISARATATLRRSCRKNCLSRRSRRLRAAPLTLSTSRSTAEGTEKFATKQSNLVESCCVVVEYSSVKRVFCFTSKRNSHFSLEQR